MNLYGDKMNLYGDKMNLYGDKMNLYNDEYFYIRPFPASDKDTLVEKVVNKCRESSRYLQNISANWSAERGFQLPLTLEWKRKMDGANCIEYHNERQLRFGNEDRGTINYLWLKDRLNYWSNEEIAELLMIINSFV
jgi:hypothetical protein